MTKEEREATIAYLRQYIVMGYGIRQKTNELENKRKLIEHITSVITGLPHGTAKNISESIGELVALEKEISDEIVKLTQIRREIEVLIKSVGDERLQTILEYKYFSGLPLYKIAVEMDIEYRWIRKLHNRALRKINLTLASPH